VVFHDLKVVLSGIPPNDLLLMLGDLYAYVELQGRSWLDMFGCFGIDDCNQAVEDLMNFVI